MSNPVQAKSAEGSTWFLNLSRVFDHSVEDVFNAWTDPELLLSWFCNNGEAEFDIVKGGKFHVFIQCESSGVAELKGEYLEIKKMKSLYLLGSGRMSPCPVLGRRL